MFNFKRSHVKAAAGLLLILLLPTSAFGAAKPTPAPSAKKTTTKSTTSTKSSTLSKSSGTKTSTSSKTKSNNFGYVGHKDSSDMDIAPILTQLSGTALDDSGAEFKLPTVASAKSVLNSIMSDLSEAGIKCEIIDPTVNPLISLTGTVKDDTLAACKYGDPSADGFIEYVITDKATVAKYNQSQYVTQYLNFQSPLIGSGKQTKFTPSLRAILFVVGGEFAFDANEISWAVLYNSRFQPPQRDSKLNK